VFNSERNFECGRGSCSETSWNMLLMASATQGKCANRLQTRIGTAVFNFEIKKTRVNNDDILWHGGLYRHNTVPYMLDAGYNFGKATEWKEILNFCTWAEASKYCHLMLPTTNEVDVHGTAEFVLQLQVCVRTLLPNCS